MVLAPSVRAQTPAAEPPAEKQPPPARAPAADDERPEIELRLKYSNPVEGRLVSRDDTALVISIAGIDTRFAMDQVESIVFLPPVEVRYEQMRALAADDDVPAILTLAQWLVVRKRYDLAEIELKRALKADPDHPVARDLMLVVEQQLKLDAGGKARRQAPRPAGEQPRVLKPDFPLLTPDDINIIRVYEVDLNDPPRMTIQRDTIQRFLDKYAGQKSVPINREGREAFFSLPRPKILGAMFEVQAREFYPQVAVLDNPRSIRLFRDNVQRVWLTNSCATTQCHGGEEAGRLRLTNKNAGTDAATYTNFLILDRFRLKDGLPLIDYTRPSRSVLLQYGLPRTDALLKHPETPGLGKAHWSRVFSNEQDPRFQAAVDWINSMYRPRPAYPVDYTPPVPADAKAREAAKEAPPR